MFQTHIPPKKYAAWDKSETISGRQASQFQMSTDGTSLGDTHRSHTGLWRRLVKASKGFFLQLSSVIQI